MNIVYIVSDGFNEFNSSNYRVCLLADAMRSAGHSISIINVRQWMSRTKECVNACTRADIIHLQRVLIKETHGFIGHWRNMGKAVVVDWDDSYDRILDTNAAADFWLRGEVSVRHGNLTAKKRLDVHPVQQFRDGLRLCTTGITPSKVLSRDWDAYAGIPNFVVKNFIDAPRYAQARNLRVNGKKQITLAWGGSLSHTQSWDNSGARTAIERILRERDNVRLLIMGDERVLKEFKVPRHKLMFHPYVTWQEWPRYLASCYDIGLAPLAGEYDDRRSALKVTEYLAMGIPFVATKSPVYEDFFEVDSGLFAEHGDSQEQYLSREKNWYESTIDLIDNLLEYNERADKNVDKGLAFDAAANVGTVEAVYQEIVNLV